MGTIISTNKSKETVSKLIRDAFDKVDTSMDYIYGKSEELIQTARDFGLEELALELENDNK